MPKRSRKPPEAAPPYNTNIGWPNVDVPPGLDPKRYPANRQVVSENVPEQRIGVPNYNQFGTPDFSVNGGQLQFKRDPSIRNRLYFRVPRNAKVKEFPRPGDHIKFPDGVVVSVDFCSAENNRATGYIDISRVAANALASMITGNEIVR